MRNKRSAKLGYQDLAPLTERILARMGAEGQEIRRRLQRFYQRRGEQNGGGPEAAAANESKNLLAGLPERN